MPNCRAVTGTRSSTPWNMPEKSRSAGSCRGAKPKQRMPSRLNDLASVPPDRQYGMTLPVWILGQQRRGHRVAQVGPSNVVSRAMSWWMNSRVTCGPSRLSTSAKNSAS